MHYMYYNVILLSKVAMGLTSCHSFVQDKAQVLSDVREIIAEQLGTDLDSVRLILN